MKPAKPKFGRIELPTEKILAIYARQSRAEQVENNPESFAMQTQRLQEIALELGWQPEDILPTFIENEQQDGRYKHASGTKRIDERPKLQEIVWLIEQDQVKAVLVWLVDRLFRDESEIEPRVFANICKAHNCIVLTSQDEMFDFNNGRDQKRFFQEADAASEFITNYLKGRALPARRQKALRGEYDGRVVPIGFTVEPKVKGVVRRYIIYEPHAEVVRWLFKRYRELGGNFSALKSEVGAKPYLFEKFPDGMYIPHIRLGKNFFGYTISDRGLKELLCNTAYIGYWYNKDAEPRRDNHPAIVSEEDFWFAFDRLSPETIDGHERVNEKSFTRYNKVGTIPVKALLKELVTSDQGKVYVSQDAGGRSGKAAYTIIQNTAYYGGDKRGSIYVEQLDSIFTTYLLERLEQGKERRQSYQRAIAVSEDTEFVEVLEGNDDAVLMAKKLAEVAATVQENTAGLRAQINQYSEEADNLEHTLHYGSKGLDGATIEKFSVRLGNLHRSIDQLNMKLSQAKQMEQDALEFIQRLDDIPTIWNDMGIEKQLRFLRLVCDTIVLTKPAQNWLQLEIHWNWADVPCSVCYIWQPKAGDGWTDEEQVILKRMYPRTDRLSILKALPGRNWTAICARAYKLKVARVPHAKNSDLHESLSTEDHEFMRTVGITFEEKKYVWWSSSGFTIQKDGGTLCSTLPQLRSRKRYATLREASLLSNCAREEEQQSKRAIFHRNLCRYSHKLVSPCLSRRNLVDQVLSKL